MIGNEKKAIEDKNSGVTKDMDEKVAKLGSELTDYREKYGHAESEMEAQGKQWKEEFAQEKVEYEQKVISYTEAIQQYEQRHVQQNEYMKEFKEAYEKREASILQHRDDVLKNKQIELEQLIQDQAEKYQKTNEANFQ